ncbi:MAG: hypothetical protein AB8I08_16545 [Sandaracinaceae bacterium]
MKTTLALGLVFLLVSGCDEGGGEDAGADPDASMSTRDAGRDAGRGSDGGLKDGGAPDGGRVDAGDGDAGRSTRTVVARVVPNGSSGTQRVSFGVPLAEGVLSDAERVVVSQGASELAASRRGLASWPDGSLRSVLVQVELDVATETELSVEVGGVPSTTPLAEMPVADTLADGEPRAWVVLPAEWLAESGFAGPLLPDAAVAGTVLDAWAAVCDVERHDTDAFLEGSGSRGVWLYDRVTALLRAYGRSGALSPLRSAYREATLYREGLTGAGDATRIGVPGAATDLKYHYTQGLALHYLLTGDDRFREAAEDVGERVAALWPSPGYAGGADFWTERHAGFGLLAYVWASIVSDDAAAAFATRADDAVTAYLEVQATYPAGYDDTSARCFAHSADAHGESYGYFGCSPWMSAILADGLEAYASLRGGDNAERARGSLIQLGRMLARDGRDGSGKPFYFLGVGTDADEVDGFDEHWGETAYVIAMAWHLDGRRDAALRSAADEVVQGFADNGTAPHVRSFNWQCRSAVAAPWFLR